MSELWTAIPLGTVPQRPRATAPSPGSVGAPRVAPAVRAPLQLSALDAPTVAVEEEPTNRLSAHLLATRVAAPMPHGPTHGRPPAPVSARQPGPPATAPRPTPSRSESSGRSPLPFLAAAALLSVAVAVLAPWPGSGPWIASSLVGLALLVGVALLTAPVTVDLLMGRDRSTVMVLGLPLMTAATVGTVVVGGGDLTAVLTTQGVGADRTAAASAVAVALSACLLVGIVGTTRRSRGARAAGAPAVIVGVCAAVSVAAVSAVVIALGAPALLSATVVTAAGETPTVRTAGSAGTACPAEAASTLPEAAAGAPLVAHDSRVHIAICQGASGALYYYGADDRTHLTITLPATRSEDSWIATNNGVTYSITPENLVVTRPGTTLADEALSSGWTR